MLSLSESQRNSQVLFPPLLCSLRDHSRWPDFSSQAYVCCAFATENKMSHVFNSKDLPKRCFQIFQEMRKNNELCDVTFQVGGESILAHRIIISAVIPYFRNIASEKGALLDEGISIPDIAPSAFKCLIEFAYTYELKIEKENAIELLSAACHLGMNSLREACCDFLSENLDPKSVLDIRDIGHKLNCTELLNDIDSYVVEIFYKIFEKNEFLKWPTIYLKDIIGRNALNVENEEHVLEAVVRWVKESPEGRKSELPQLLTKVRMSQIQPRYLVQLIAREEFIRTSFACRDLIDEAKNHYLFPDLKTICSFSTEPRQPTAGYFVRDTGNKSIYKFHRKIEYRMQQFDVERGKWITKQTDSYSSVSEGIAELHNKMYYFVCGDVLEYDPVEDSYKYLNFMPTARIDTAAASLNDKIYVFGGRVGSYRRTNPTACNGVECFDPETNEWEEMAPMSTGRWGLNAVALGTYIFVLGGRNRSSSFDYVDRYDPTKNKWRRMTSMLTKRYFAGAVAHNGNIYATGGKTLSEGTKCVVAVAEVYNPLKNTWTGISPMNTPRCEFTLLSCRRKLYVLGGEDDSAERIHTFDIYDPENDKWTAGPSTDSSRFTSGAVVMSC